MPHWPCYILSLPSNTHRATQLQAQLKSDGLMAEIFYGVDGATLSAEAVKAVYDIPANHQKGRKPLRCKEIGCYLGHYNLWQRIAQTEHDGAHVFEDDAIILPHLSTMLDNIEQDDGDWDMVKLFHGFQSITAIKHRVINSKQSFALVTPQRVPNFTVAYTLRKKGAQTLLKTMLPMLRPVDEQFKFLWEHHIKIKVTVPSLVVHDPTPLPRLRDNDISFLRLTRSPIQQLLHNIKYQLSLRWKTYCYHRRMSQRQT